MESDICPLCNKDVNKEMHAPGCPYEGLNSGEFTLRFILSHGWECPKCHKIYSPLTTECKSCNEKPEEDKDGQN